MSTKCTLCDLPLPKSPIVHEKALFCCSGCATVHQILAHQKADFSHPLYQEAVKAGMLSNPDLIEKVKEKMANTKQLHLVIEGMWCPACATAIRWLLLRQKGVNSAFVDYATDMALIEYDPCQCGAEDIRSFIRRIGYSPASILDPQTKGTLSLWIRFSFSLFALLNLMMFAYPLYLGTYLEGYEKALGWLSFSLAVPLITYGALPFWRRFVVSLRVKRFGMETLVLLGMSSAFVYSLSCLLKGDYARLYFDSMAMVLVSVLLGKILEKKAKFSAKEVLFRVTRTLPKRGRRRSGEGFAWVPLKEIQQGDILSVRLGEKVVLDGEVIDGEGYCDEAVMTGEPRLCAKRPSSRVVGGSLVRRGSFLFRVTATYEESLLSKLLYYIERDLENPPYAQPFDRIVPIFVPLVVLLALFSGTSALAVLLIACPCAIGIAIPLAESILIRKCAEEGILVRNRRALYTLAKDPYFVFDKTGTLTEGNYT
ncbi:MAG: heavy metal translocating P-type ATPase, partial [Chlamydiales bacterium]